MSNPFQVILLPDTQHYSDLYPEIFNKQTEWIAERVTSHNIKAVIHLGDIVEHGDNTTEWVNADAAMQKLDVAGVPYSVLPGNHDLDTNPPTNYNLYFGPDRFTGKSWYVNHRGTNNDYNVIEFEADGFTYWVLSMKYSPSRGAGSATEWANTLLAANQDKRVILATHSFLDTDGSYTGSGTNIFNDIVAINPNIFLVVCGHMHGVAYRQENVLGNAVEMLLQDFQDELHPDDGVACGNGWLRVLTLYP